MQRLVILAWFLMSHIYSGLCKSTTPPDTDEQENMQGRLYNDLLSNYTFGSYMRPVYNTSTVTTVIYRMLVHELIDLDVLHQRITIGTLLKLTWQDEILRWNATEYGGINTIQLPSDYIWIPDITLHRNTDPEFEHVKPTRAAISYDGTVNWFAPAIFTSACRIHVRYFPFDTQFCTFQFGSWAYNGVEIDLHPANGSDAEQNSFLRDGAWDLQEVITEREVIKYDCCPETYPEVSFTLILRRRSRFYVLYLIVPCVFLSALSVLVFYLPAECGEKLTLSITNLLALVVFDQLIAESMPHTSGDDAPLIGDYFLAMITMVCLSVVTTVVVIHVSAKTEAVPLWIHFIFLRCLARLLCMYKPEFDQEPVPIQKLHVSSTMECAFNVLKGDGDDRLADKESDQQNGAFTLPSSVIDDLHFIQKSVEESAKDELIVQQWKHFGKIIDRCLLWIFLTFASITTVVLICRARGPQENDL